TPGQINIAMTAIQPFLKERSITVAPTPLSNPILHHALPGVVIVPLPRIKGEPGKPPSQSDLVVIAPGQKPVVYTDGETVWQILKGYPPVLTDEEARQYVRVHLLLVAARHPHYKFGPVGPIKVTPRDTNGRTAEGEMPVVSRPKYNN